MAQRQVFIPAADYDAVQWRVCSLLHTKVCVHLHVIIISNEFNVKDTFA